MQSRRQRLRPSSQTSVTATTYPVTNDTPPDIEPVDITDTLHNADGSSYYRTTGVWTKEEGTPAVPNNYWTTTDFVNFAGYPTGQKLQPTPIPNTTRTGDPMLSENPYLNVGINPKRTYCSGVAYDINSSNGYTSHSTLAVWYTDDPGAGAQSFQLYGGQPIAQSDYPYFHDKPSITTSWFSGNAQKGSTLGWTYVADVSINQNTGQHTIELYCMSATGGPFTLVNNQYYAAAATSPIVLVDYDTGDVYLIWDAPSPGDNLIRIARSTDNGSTFTLVGTIYPTGLLVGDGVALNGSVSGFSCVMAQYNSYDKSIGIVWHNREAGASVRTDVYFASFSTANQILNNNGNPVHVGHTPINDGLDQWNPSLDCSASTGEYLVTWYDRRNDPNDITYEVYATKIAPNGTPIDTVDAMTYDARAAADTNSLPQIGGLRLMGEYQGVWEWYGTWYTATTYITPSGYQDIFMPQVSP